MRHCERQPFNDYSEYLESPSLEKFKKYIDMAPGDTV